MPATIDRSYESYENSMWTSISWRMLESMDEIKNVVSSVSG